MANDDLYVCCLAANSETAAVSILQTDFPSFPLSCRCPVFSIPLSYPRGTGTKLPLWASFSKVNMIGQLSSILCAFNRPPFSKFYDPILCGLFVIVCCACWNSKSQHQGEFEVFRRRRQYSPHLLRYLGGTNGSSGIKRSRPMTPVSPGSRNFSHFIFSHVSVSRAYLGSSLDGGRLSKSESTKNRQWVRSVYQRRLDKVRVFGMMCLRIYWGPPRFYRSCQEAGAKLQGKNRIPHSLR